MVFCIISNIEHIKQNDKFFSYAPYIKEMCIWIKDMDKIIIVAPIENIQITPIHDYYKHSDIQFVKIDKFDLRNLKSILNSILKIPRICIKIYKAMKSANHIHLRCPGNVGLLGCVIQILFPNKSKTAKYAGNWDPNAKNPWSYRLQKYILGNTCLTKKMQVLVYGEWENSSKNIRPFFTATYHESDIIQTPPRKLENNIKMLFVGTLVTGKRPFYAIQLVEKLMKNALNIQLTIFGEGNQKRFIEEYIAQNSLQKNIFINGNQNTNFIKKAYQESHFIILPSESEGWPKVVAEGMFWGCVPLVTKISCIPYMINEGERGLVLTMDLQNDVRSIQQLIQNTNQYELMSQRAQEWSIKYTLNYFEKEIKVLLQS